jgi:hypothetical protein
MRYAILPWVLLALLWLGCDSPGFEPPTRVSDLRILAVRVEPPEIEMPLSEDAEPIPVRVTALIATPTGAAVHWQLTACPYVTNQACEEWRANEGSVRQVLDDIDAGRLEPVAGGPPEVRVETERLFSAALIHSLLQSAQLGGLAGSRPGFEIQAIADGVRERAMKRMQISLPDIVYRLVLDEAGIPICDEVGLPEGCLEYRTKVANTNPDIEAIRYRRIARDGDDAPEQDLPEDEPLMVAPGEAVRLVPHAVEGSAEDYQTLAIDFEHHTVRIEDRTELLIWSWFSTAGGFALRETEEEHTLGAFNTWTAPMEAPGEEGDVWIWIVLRDNRGGVDFRTVHVRVDPERDPMDPDDDLDGR